MSDFVLEDDSDLGAGTETVLPTFVVLARFAAPGPQDAAVDGVRRALREAQEPFDDVRVEREEPDGTVMVLARFVVVSVDAHTAAAGVHDDLRAAGVPVDEVWVDAKV